MGDVPQPGPRIPCPTPQTAVDQEPPCGRGQGIHPASQGQGPAEGRDLRSRSRTLTAGSFSVVAVLGPSPH